MIKVNNNNNNNNDNNNNNNNNNNDNSNYSNKTIAARKIIIICSIRWSSIQFADLACVPIDIPDLHKN